LVEDCRTYDSKKILDIGFERGFLYKKTVMTFYIKI
jgi:hypothetical protein